MKTQTLAFIYSLSGGISFFVAKFCYLNEIVPHWFPLWLDMMVLVSLGAIVAVIYTNRRRAVRVSNEL